MLPINFQCNASQPDICYNLPTVHLWLKKKFPKFPDLSSEGSLSSEIPFWHEIEHSHVPKVTHTHYFVPSSN